jgi:F-type H+-transporting ATPase subunit b
LQIDWLTVAAQIVNFLVLVWLLQRFLYKPITNAMRRREERIEERLSEAKSARTEAEKEAEALRRKEAELEDSKAEILNAAREEADALRERLEAEIREEMEEKRAAWQAHLAEERDAFVTSLRRQAGKQVLEITERVLSDYADSDTAERVVATFAERLKALDAETREKMTKAAAEENQPALVHTGSALESSAKGRITRAIHETLSSDIEVDYREDADMVLGVRLTIGDYTAEWSAMRYLKRLETELGEIIDAGTHAGAKGEGSKAETDDENAGEGGGRDRRREDHETA